jgi:hypothetical protein
MPRETPAKSRAAASSRRHRKRMLAVSAMAGEVAWLDAPLRWRDGRAAWETRRGPVFPDPAALALAQRRLNQIAGYPRAARRALGDLEGWLGLRRLRLGIAKYLAPLRAPDLESLVGAHDPPALERLARLLSAEALCQGALPASPARALLGSGERALPALHTLIADEAAPHAGRALAAMVLGALARENRDPAPQIAASGRGAPEQSSSFSLHAFFEWGRRAGLPPDPSLAVALLSDPEGEALARRYAETLRSASPFRLAPERLRSLLADGARAATVVALAEAAAAAEPLAARLLDLRGELPPVTSRQRGSVAKRLRHEREAGVAALAATLSAAAGYSPEPAIYPAFSRLALALLAPGTFTPQLAGYLSDAIHTSCALLAPPLITPYLQTLAEQAERDIAAPGFELNKTPAQFARWLDDVHAGRIQALLELLRAGVVPELAAEALALGVIPQLFAVQGADAGLQRALLAMVRDFKLESDIGLTRRIAHMLEVLGDAQAVRALWLPLLRALMGVEPWMRYHFLEAAVGALPRERRLLRDALPRLLRHAAPLLRFAASDPSEWCACHETITAALALDRADPEAAPRWLGWLLDALRERPAGDENEWGRVLALRLCLPLAVVLARGDLPRFQAIVRAAMTHTFDQNEDLIDRSHALLGRYAGLREPVAALFHQQPARCLRLLERVGLIARLGSAGEAALALLASGRNASGSGAGEPAPEPSSAIENPKWGRLLTLAPELLADAEAFVRAQRLLGQPEDPPAGVRDTMGLPRKLAGELAYIETLLAREPGRADLAARARALAERLGDADGLLLAARREAGERLRQRRAEAELAAAEQQVLACFRQRLELLAGPLPAGLALDDDLLNATLLANDISSNRKLLLRLLRAHLAGDLGWRQRHPANAALLQRLAESGVDPALWLAAQPRVYRFGAVAGGRVRLHAETNPLRILQMGNYSDTCLSFGGANAFSAVANACELNKRVIYAADGAGHVVGRQLVALNADGGLVGFHVYTSLPNQESAAALRALFRRYAADFAARCGLALADDGRVPLLFAERWYDDGIVPWDSEDGAVAHRSKP